MTITDVRPRELAIERPEDELGTAARRVYTEILEAHGYDAVRVYVDLIGAISEARIPMEHEADWVRAVELLRALRRGEWTKVAAQLA